MITKEKQMILVANQSADRVVHFTDYLLTKASTGQGRRGFSCSFPAFDAHMKGLKVGEVIVVTGKKKNGKTLFAESWIRSMMKKDPAAKACILSFEVSPEDLLAKYMSEETLPVYLPLELKTMDFDWLFDRCLEAKLKYNCNIILLDHMHFLVDMNTKQNMSLNIGAFMRRLKHDVAIGMDLAVILIAHQSSLKSDEEASSDSLRDSSFIGQECDSVVVVSRKKNYTTGELDKILLKDGADRFAYIQSKNSINQPLHDEEENDYSAGFATIKIDVNRRTGVFGWRKVFQKQGDFLEEI